MEQQAGWPLGLSVPDYPRRHVPRRSGRVVLVATLLLASICGAVAAQQFGTGTPWPGGSPARAAAG
jgi:hypothetical protein